MMMHGLANFKSNPDMFLRYMKLTLLVAGDKLLHGNAKGTWKVRKLSSSLHIQHIFLSKTVIWWSCRIKEVDTEGTAAVV
jgi:hypothetical protein